MTLSRWLKSLAMAAILIVAFTACGQSEPPPAPKDDGMVPLRVSVLNYTDDYIDEVYVNNSWASNGLAHSGGGGFAGGAEVPRQWDPNYTLTIRWRDEILYAKDPDAFHERKVVTEPYQQDERGRMTFLWVAFFPGGVLKLYPTLVAPGHPDFPGGLLEPQLQCRKEFPGSPKCEIPTSPEEQQEQQKENKTP